MIRRRPPGSRRKAIGLSVGAVLLFAVASNSQAGWVFVLSAAVFGIVIAGAVLPGIGLRGLEIRRRVPANCRSGDRVAVALDIRNRSRAPRALIEGGDTLFAGRPFFIEQIAAGDSAELRYEVEAGRRGIYRGGTVDLRTGAPLGIRNARRRVEVESAIVVHPKWVHIPSFPLLESASTPHEVLHERRRGTGMEFYGIREYRSGDSFRHVHWRSSARTGRLYVREFEEQFASRLGVLIDAGERIGAEPKTTFEDAVACAASLIVYALEAGHPAQILCDSRAGIQHLFEPARLEALDWLAALEADGRRGLARLASDVAGEFQRRSTNVLLFAATHRNAAEAREAAAILQARASRVIAIMFSAFSYGSDRRALDPVEEQALAARLGDEHVMVYRVRMGEDLAQCLREPSLV